MAAPTPVGSNSLATTAVNPVTIDLGTLTGSERYLIVAFGHETNRAVSAITFGGQALTLLGPSSPLSEATSGKDLFFYGLDETGIAAASSTILSITFSANIVDEVLTAAWFSDCDPTTPVSGMQSNALFNTSPAVPAITSSTDALVVAAMIIRNNATTITVTSGTELEEIGSTGSGNTSHKMEMSSFTGAASVTPAWSVSGGGSGWVAIGISVNGVAAGGSPYTLTADPGAVVITGTDATLTRSSYTLAADAGSFSITGTDASFHTVVLGDSGEFLITGTDATLTYGQLGDITLIADPGSVSIAGTAAGLLWPKKIIAAPGEVLITGMDAALRYSEESSGLTSTGNITDILTII